MESKEVVDQMGRTVMLKSQPKRIVSIVPSQTELLYYLGITPIAQTLFCIHPKPAFKAASKVGGTKKLNMSKIKSLSPDLIIGNKEENQQKEIEDLAKDYPVWMSDIHNLNSALAMILELGQLLNVQEAAEALVKKISLTFQSYAPPISKENVLYLIWRKPYMAAGRRTFINSMLSTMGLSNSIKDAESRYPEVSLEQLIELTPSYIFLSSEPYPFKQKHIQELQEILPNAQIILVNGEMFSWYGSRLLQFPAYFKSIDKKLGRSSIVTEKS